MQSLFDLAGLNTRVTVVNCILPNLASCPPMRLTHDPRADDWVTHPSHGRNAAAKLSALGHTVLYQELNTGTHGRADTVTRQASIDTHIGSFLWKELTRGQTGRTWSSSTRDEGKDERCASAG